MKIYWIVMIFILLMSSYFVISAYYSSLANKQRDTLDKLEAIATTLSFDFSGDELQNLLQTFTNRDDLTYKKSNPIYFKLHQKLNRAKVANKLNSDVYTLTYDSADNNFFFGITSGETPYYRHIYNSHPEDYINKYLNGGQIGKFEDENGVWLSAISPIKTSQDKVVGVIAVDQHFDDFTQEARKLLLKDAAISIVVILVLSLSLRRILLQILHEEERAKQVIEQSRQLLQTKNKKITDSIQYAKRIQEALMRDNQTYINSAADAFQIYLPRDIVSGDFLWYYKDILHDKLFIASVDCTGHGVPGALISILGMSALQEIIVDRGTQKPDDILNLLDHRVKDLLRQHEDHSEAVRDGMDIGLCVIDYPNMQLEFSGAHIPLVLVSEGNLTVIKGNRLAIGGHRNKRKKQLQTFDCHTMAVKPKDRIYLYSDGIVDQFGGHKEKAEKFKTRRLHSKIKEIQHEPMEKQGELLLSTFEEWKGIEKQLDDVSMVGIEI